MRATLYRRLKNKEINYLFVVDMFNEGVDIPEVDTILFLRPTNSLTVFIHMEVVHLFAAKLVDRVVVIACHFIHLTYSLYPKCIYR